MIEIGEKKRFGISFQVCTIIKESNVMWGGFEIWINNYKFGDAFYFDLISGNNLDLIKRLVVDEAPAYPFKEYKNPHAELEEIFSNYFNSKTERSLKEQAEWSTYWGQFILSPNGTIPFDKFKLAYFGDDQTVTFLYQILESNKTKEFILETQEVKSVAESFLVVHDEILAGKMQVKLIAKTDLK